MSSLISSLIGPNVLAAGAGSQNALTNTGMGQAISGDLCLSAGSSSMALKTDGGTGITWSNATTPHQRNLPHLINPERNMCSRCGKTILELEDEPRLFGSCQPKNDNSIADLLIIDDPARKDDYVDTAPYLMQLRKLQDSINNQLSIDLHGFIAGNPHFPRRKVLLLCGI